MRAIDLYAGIGGWSLGLQLAGIEVVASYEWWQPAVDTHNANLGADDKATDIRALDFCTLPTDIDLVVGSPPCTEFSYSNRGGSGDLAEGLKDLVRFFEAVDHVRPRYWIMENVPRVAEVLRHGFQTKGHALYRFKHLTAQIEVIDFSDFGVPQARKRCIAGNISFELLRSYTTKVKRRTLGDVVSAFQTNDRVIDPVWGVALSRNALTEMETEAPLNREELRMNREAKEFHPVYNNMAFPDRLTEPARTVTATCTRVSRESVVIEDPNLGHDAASKYRRLTVRERASLQGFPITYQFYAKSFSEKAKMVGNAIPPPFTYLAAMAAKGVKPNDLPTFAAAAANLALPEKVAPVTQPDTEGRSYPAARKFRAALPHLRFKSGMRFDLSNDFSGGEASWVIRFFYGPSKDVQEIVLDEELWLELQQAPLLARAWEKVQTRAATVEQLLWATDPVQTQNVWTRRADGPGPYEITDQLGALADQLHAELTVRAGGEVIESASTYLMTLASDGEDKKPAGSAKLTRNTLRVLSGLMVGAWFNSLGWHEKRRKAA